MHNNCSDWNTHWARQMLCYNKHVNSSFLYTFWLITTQHNREDATLPLKIPFYANNMIYHSQTFFAHRSTNPINLGLSDDISDLREANKSNTLEVESHSHICTKWLQLRCFNISSPLRRDFVWQLSPYGGF